MRKILLGLILGVIVFGCGQKKRSRKELIEADRIELNSAIDCYSVNRYKFFKICLRASRVQDTSEVQYKQFWNKTDKALKIIKDVEFDESLSVTDAINLYSVYNDVSDHINSTDEDVFPLVTEAISFIYADSTDNIKPLLKGDEKIAYQCIEHAVLSLIASVSFGNDVSLYEISKTNVDIMKDSETKALFNNFRAFMYLRNNLFYLSEDAFSNNINWLNSNSSVLLPLTKRYFKWDGADNKQVFDAFHSIQYLGRGLSRLLMTDSNDNELGFNDLEIFLKDADKLKLQSELVWSIEAYLYLHRNKSDEAIESLKRLHSSNLLGTEEREVVAESIKYIEKRESGRVFNSIYDKVFITKIATKYIVSVLGKIDWYEVLKENDIPDANEILVMLKSIERINNQIDRLSGNETLEQVTDDIKDKGEDLLDKAKDLF